MSTCGTFDSQTKVSILMHSAAKLDDSSSSVKSGKV